MKQDLELAFDVGHSSIGWQVLQANTDVEIKGWCKEQEMKNGVQDGVRREISAKAEIVSAR